jgi:hypothetical protein
MLCFASSSRLFVLSTAFLLISSCGKKSKNDDSEDIDPSKFENPVNTSLDNELAAAFPIGLSLSALTATEAKATKLADDGEGVPVATADTAEGVINVEEQPKPPNEKADEMAAIIDADKPEQCRPTLLIRKLTNPDCYAGGVETEGSATTGKDKTGKDVSTVTIPADLKPIRDNVRGVRFGDSGVIQAKQGENACLADTAGYYVNSTAETVERATGLIASALCAAKAKGVQELPKAKGKRDLTKEVGAVWNLPKTVKVEKFVISRVDNGDETKDPIYRTFLKVRYQVPNIAPPGQPGAEPGAEHSATLGVELAETPPKPGDQKGKAPLPPRSEIPRQPPGLLNNLQSRTLVVELINNPDKAKGDTEYKGRILVLESGRTGEAMGNMGQPKKQVRGIAIGYKREGDNLKYRFSGADFNAGESAENSPLKFIDIKTGFFKFKDIARKSNIEFDGPFVKGGNSGASQTMNVAMMPPPPQGQGPGQGPGQFPGQGNVVQNAIAGSAEYNTTTQAGKMAFHWQASLRDKAARSFMVNTTADTTTGDLSGCGAAGFSGAFGSEKQGKLQGFYCGWAQQKNDNTPLDTKIHPAVQQQCFGKSAAATVWTLDDAKNAINYSVAEDCGAGLNDVTKYNLVSLVQEETKEVQEPEATEAEMAVQADVVESEMNLPAE